MSTAASLMVNLLANTSQFGPPLDEARRTLGETFKPPGSIGELSHSLHGLEGQLRGMNALLGLGLGATLGRHLFAEAHEAVMHFGEGFVDAMGNGRGFFESMSDGARKLLGLKTALEEVGEAMKRNAELAKEGRTMGDILERTRGLAEPKKERDPRLVQAEQLTEQMAQKMKEAQRRAMPELGKNAFGQDRRVLVAGSILGRGASDG